MSSQEETRSDHLYVLHHIKTPVFQPSIPLYKWNVRPLDSDRMKEVYLEAVFELSPQEPWGEEEVQAHQRAIQYACAVSMREGEAPS